MLQSAMALARLAEAPRCLVHRSATTLDNLTESPVRSGAWPRARVAGCAHGAVRAITSPKRAVLQVVAAMSAPSLRRTRLADAFLATACAQARLRRGFDQ